MLNLKLFTGHSVTVYSDSGFSAASASPNSSVAENAEVTLTLTNESGYEIDEVECVAGGVTVNLTTKKFSMPNADVVLFAKSKANNKYMVTESVVLHVNNAELKLQKNTELILAANGAIIGVSAGGGTAISTCGAAIDGLVAAGVLVKI